MMPYGIWIKCCVFTFSDFCHSPPPHHGAWEGKQQYDINMTPLPSKLNCGCGWVLSLPQPEEEQARDRNVADPCVRSQREGGAYTASFSPLPLVASCSALSPTLYSVLALLIAIFAVSRNIFHPTFDWLAVGVFFTFWHNLCYPE